MGNWTIVIEGHGIHHNRLESRDANRMAADFVQRLKDVGHEVHYASFTHSGIDFINHGAAYNETRDDIEKPKEG